MRKPAFCICENKDADQLRSNREADQRLCFRYIDSTTPLLSKSEISNLLPFSGAVQPGLCWTRSETPKTGFLTTDSYIITVMGYYTLSIGILNPYSISCLIKMHDDYLTIAKKRKLR